MPAKFRHKDSDEIFNLNGADPRADALFEGTDQDRLWTVQDLASYLGVPVNTVYKWRTTGGGPPACVSVGTCATAGKT